MYDPCPAHLHPLIADIVASLIGAAAVVVSMIIAWMRSKF